MWLNPKVLASEFPSFLEVVNAPKVFELFERLLGGPAITFDYKWPRAVGRGGNTGAHYDVVYMGRGTKNLYTMWTPMADIPLEQGTLAMLLGSQHYDKVKETYGQIDVDRDNVATGWLSEDPIELVDTFGGQWASTEFLFGMFMMHASFNNTSDRYRISSDTRYQLASDPADPRWVGENPVANYAWGKEPWNEVVDEEIYGAGKGAKKSPPRPLSVKSGYFGKVWLHLWIST